MLGVLLACLAFPASYLACLTASPQPQLVRCQVWFEFRSLQSGPQVCWAWPLEGQGTTLLFPLLIPPTSIPPSIVRVYLFVRLFRKVNALLFWINIFEAGISISFKFFNVRLFGWGGH